MADTTKKGKPFTFRTTELIDLACQKVATDTTEETGIKIMSVDVKKAIFNAGIKPFFESKNIPTDREELKEWLKECMEEIQE